MYLFAEIGDEERGHRSRDMILPIRTNASGEAVAVLRTTAVTAFQGEDEGVVTRAEM